MTQAELSRRMGTTQSAIARLEAADANPSVATLERALAATGHRLELRATRTKSSIDESLLVRNLKLTPSQRLEAFETAYDQVRQIARAGAVARGELA